MSTRTKNKTEPTKQQITKQTKKTNERSNNTTKTNKQNKYINKQQNNINT